MLLRTYERTPQGIPIKDAKDGQRPPPFWGSDSRNRQNPEIQPQAWSYLLSKLEIEVSFFPCWKIECADLLELQKTSSEK